MNRTMLSQLVAATMTRVQHASWLPRLELGTVAEEDVTPSVLLDSSTPDVSAGPVTCRCVGDPPGVGERVAVLVVNGKGWVLGRLAGSIRNYGTARVTANQGGITSATITDAAVTFTVTQPGRLLLIWAQSQFLVTDSGSAAVGNILLDGTIVGRFGRFTAAFANDTRTLSGFALVGDATPLAPGTHTVTLTAVLTGSGTIDIQNATTPTLVAVTDGGNIAGSP